jgi:hypothetical protein
MRTAPAWPPDVRKGFAFPAAFLIYLARLRLAMIEA